MKKVLVIGGTGTISSPITRKLANDPDVKLYMLNRGQRKDKFGDKVERLIGDIRNETEKVKKLIQDLHFDTEGRVREDLLKGTGGRLPGDHCTANPDLLRWPLSAFD